MYVCVCLSVGLRVFVFMFVCCLFVSSCQYVCVFGYWVFACLNVFAFGCLRTCDFVGVFVFVCLCVCLFVVMFVYCLFVLRCLYVCVIVCLSSGAYNMIISALNTISMVCIV